MEPEVSDIIPYYHGRQWLPRSLSSALGQDGVVLEVIVVDDGSDLSPDDMPSARSDARLRLRLVTNRPRKAVRELANAIQADWRQMNSYYLLGKSVVLSRLSAFKRRRSHV